VRVVALREPVKNLISNYFYWHHLQSDSNFIGHCLYRYFCDTQPDLIQFATIPALRELMSGIYFRGVDMACFDVIGDYRDIDGYLRRVANLIGAQFGNTPTDNVTPRSEERRAVSEDHRLLARLRDLLAADLRFYERYACG
jgi:hypothetical protein